MCQETPTSKTVRAWTGGLERVHAKYYTQHIAADYDSSFHKFVQVCRSPLSFVFRGSVRSLCVAAAWHGHW